MLLWELKAHNCTMDKLIQQKLEKLIPIIYDYLKQTKPNAGVIDFAQLGAEVINYMEAIYEINYSNKSICQAYLTYLIDLVFKNGLPDFVLQQILLAVQQVRGYSNTAKILYSKLP